MKDLGTEREAYLLERYGRAGLERRRSSGKAIPPPPRPCRKIGCKNITTNRNGYCDAHQDIARQKEEERQKKWEEKQKRDSSAKRGYGPAWQKLREARLRSSPLCDVCGKAATVVHHRDHNAFNDTWDNLQCLCRNCHEELHGRKKRIEHGRNKSVGTQAHP